MNTREINIPFQGFYQSYYNDAIDSYEGYEAENFNEDDPRLPTDEYASILWRCADYSTMFRKIAKRYTECFSQFIKEETGVDLALQFSEMTSPREYNFTTDRIFAKIPLEAMYKVADAVTKEYLVTSIKERHSSRSGFISFYPNRLEDWPQELEDWDENHLGTLLAAFMGQHLDNDDWEMSVYYEVDDCGFVGEVYSDCVDWAKFEQLKAEKLTEIEEVEHE